jgi:uncharacterized protein
MLGACLVREICSRIESVIYSRWLSKATAHHECDPVEEDLAVWSRMWLVPIGFVVGAYGTLIGAGGGFVLMPLLLLSYPTESPEVLTSISLAVVFFNALSGSITYARMKRIDYESGILFAAATVPGAILGAIVTTYIPRRLFDGVFGVLLVMVAAVLMFRGKTAEGGFEGARPHEVTRTLVEADGTRHTYSYKPAVGIGISLFVGFLSSLLGIGGGIIHVPALVYLMNFPVHVATATSHFVLAVMALTGTGVHVATGAFSSGVRRTVALTIGVLLGAPLGARLSNRVHGGWIIRSLAIGLGFIGFRILLQAVLAP